jgi:hypothetical protein
MPRSARRANGEPLLSAAIGAQLSPRWDIKDPTQATGPALKVRQASQDICSANL